MKHKKLRLSLILALFVVAMGAYTRLKDAGLGCPDWPNCFGYTNVYTAEQNLDTIKQNYPDLELDSEKAWLEMIHRYAAGLLGILIIVCAIIEIINAKKLHIISTVIIAAVCMQVTLGMLTVTENLIPTVVLSHLAGGFTIFSLLCIWYLSKKNTTLIKYNNCLPKAEKWANYALAAIIIQICLGGWMAANYAATTCTTFPICEKNWYQNLQPIQAIIGFLGEHENYEFGVLNYNARMTIHVFHRFGAILTCILVGYFAFRLFKINQSKTNMFAKAILTILSIQIALGVSHIFFKFPVYIGVMHNLFGLLLLATCVSIKYILNISGKRMKHEI